MLCSLPSSVIAHGLMPMGLLPYWEGDELVAAATNLGIITKVDGTFVWRSELEVDPDIYWNGFRADGIPLIGTSEGLMITEDRGCHWSTLEALGGEGITAFAPSPNSSGTYLVGTGTEGKSNAIYENTEGDEWAKIPSTEIDGVYTGIQYAGGSQHYIALSKSADGTTYKIHTTGENSHEWTAQSIEFSESRSIRLLGVAGEEGEDALVAAWIPDPDDESGTKGEDHLLRVKLSTGEQSTLGSIGPYVKLLYAAGQHSSGIFATDTDDILYKFDGTELAVVEGDTRHCINDKLMSGKLIACGERPQEYAFYSSDDGTAWEGLLRFDDIELDPCPDSGGLGDGGASQSNGSGATTLKNTKKGSGGCAAASSLGFGWFALVLGLGLRRRRF